MRHPDDPNLATYPRGPDGLRLGGVAADERGPPPFVDSVLLACVVAVTTIACIGLVVINQLHDRTAIGAFMQECMQDHKRYE